MAQEQHLLVLLTMIVQSALDKCLPGEAEPKKLLTFLSQPHAANGVPAPFRDSQLSDLVARICQTIQMHSTLPTYNSNASKRQRSATLNRESLHCSVLSTAPRYAVVRINGHHFGRDNQLAFLVWHEPGSSDTLEPFANIHHLDALVKYEKRLEACSENSGVKGSNKAEAAHYKYLVKRNKEAAALDSEDDRDTEVPEPELLPQPSLGGSTSTLGTPAALSLDSPVTSEQQGWDDLLEAGDWMLEGKNWMQAVELYQSGTVAALPGNPLTRA
jgi:hypothetical protein